MCTINDILKAAPISEYGGTPGSTRHLGAPQIACMFRDLHVDPSADAEELADLLAHDERFLVLTKGQTHIGNEMSSVYVVEFDGISTAIVVWNNSDHQTWSICPAGVIDMVRTVDSLRIARLTKRLPRMHRSAQVYLPGSHTTSPALGRQALPAI